jgi:hypothetical protein
VVPPTSPVMDEMDGDMVPVVRPVGTVRRKVPVRVGPVSRALPPPPPPRRGVVRATASRLERDVECDADPAEDTLSESESYGPAARRARGLRQYQRCAAAAGVRAGASARSRTLMAAAASKVILRCL